MKAQGNAETLSLIRPARAFKKVSNCLERNFKAKDTKWLERNWKESKAGQVTN